MSNKPKMFANAEPQVPASVDTNEKPAMSDMDMLKVLLAKFDKATVAKLTKEVSDSRHTLLSVTMDAIVEAGDVVITANVVKRTTELGREHDVLKAGEEASVTSVAQLIRHVQAYRSAVKRAENKPAIETDEQPATTDQEASYVEAPAT